MAVSGGADSLALLLLAHAAYGDRIEAATIDHGLRPESANEATFVRRVCDDLRVSHWRVEVKVERPGNLSDAARRARYGALDAWADLNELDGYATAHHADDQLETVIMRLNRGSGVTGLAGIRARQGKVVRPLLGWRRAELAEIVAGAGLEPVDDPSNRDDRFDRARLRKALADADWLDAQAVAKSAALLAEADAALEWASGAKGAPTDRVELDAFQLAKLPPELRRRHVLAALQRVEPTLRPRGDALTRLIDTLAAGGTATLGRVLCSSRGGQWRFTRAAERRRA